MENLGQVELDVLGEQTEKRWAWGVLRRGASFIIGDASKNYMVVFYVFFQAVLNM